MEKLIESYFLVPVNADNFYGGGKHSNPKWEKLERIITLKFRGFTRSENLYVGEWFDNEQGKVIKDKSKKYIVALKKGEIEEMKIFLSNVAVEFGQICIFFSVKGEIFFIERKV